MGIVRPQEEFSITIKIKYLFKLAGEAWIRENVLLLLFFIFEK
jgi:hypothetical protein